MSPTVAESLGRFVAQTPEAAIPADVRARARISLVHNLTVALAGRAGAGVTQAVARRFHALPAEASLLACGSRVAVEAAAFANGALIHTRSQDDTHAASTSHPGAPVMAAALAVAEVAGASGSAFLTAVILGYEVLCRVGRDFDQKVTGRGYRAAALVGGFGAAAASARLMGLDAAGCAAALGLAAHQAGGLAQVWVEGSPEFPAQLGFAARNGLFSARLAAAGSGAAREIFEGRAGFWAATAGGGAPAVEVLAGLGDDWQFREVTVKPYPACAILQGPLEALGGLVARGAVGPDLAALELRLNPFEAGYAGIDNPGPFASATATKMSAQFCLGVMAGSGTLTMADLKRTEDPRALALAPRIRVVADPAVPERQCRLRVRTASGKHVRAQVTQAVGQPDWDGIAAFARRMAPEMEASAPAVEALLAAVAGIDEARDLGPLLAACRGITG